MLKVVLIGDSGVGKTSVWRALAGLPVHVPRPTVGMDCTTVRCPAPGGGDTVVALWDTAGLERYRSLVASYYRDAAAVVLVYDAADPDSAAGLQRWLDELFLHNVPATTPLILVGNKADLLSAPCPSLGPDGPGPAPVDASTPAAPDPVAGASLETDLAGASFYTAVSEALGDSPRGSDDGVWAERRTRPLRFGDHITRDDAASSEALRVASVLAFRCGAAAHYLCAARYGPDSGCDAALRAAVSAVAERRVVPVAPPPVAAAVSWPPASQRRTAWALCGL